MLTLVILTGGLLFLGGATQCVAQQLEPSPDPKAVVQSGPARFTVLTDSIIRMQYGQTHDDPTFTVLNRRLPVPDFKQKQEAGRLVITTKNLELSYLLNSEGTFSEENLQVYLSYIRQYSFACRVDLQ